MKRNILVGALFLLVSIANGFAQSPFVQANTLSGSVVGGSVQYGNGNVTLNLQGYTGSTIVIFSGQRFSIECQYGGAGLNACTVPAGINSTTYKVFGSYVTADTPITVTASVYGNPGDPGVPANGVDQAPHASISFAANVVGGSTDLPTATVILDYPVKDASSVFLGSQPNLLNFGNFARTIPAGGSSVDFPLQGSSAVSQDTVSTLSCDYGVGCSKMATVKVNPISITATSPITGNGQASGSLTVSLGSAIQEPASIQLDQAPWLLSLQASAHISAGASSSDPVPFTAFSVTQPSTTTVTATWFGSATAAVTVLPTGKDADGPCPGGAWPNSCTLSNKPINLTNGNVWIDQQDVSLPGLAGGIQVARTWNSLWLNNTSIGVNGIFGHSWRSNLEERLEFISGGGKKYWRANGSSWIFNYDSMSQGYILVSPADEHGSLAFNSSTGVFTLTMRGGTQKFFNNSGYLTGWADRNGNQTTITLNGSLPTQVSNASGRSITLSYNAPGNANLVSSIQDTAGGIGTIATYVYDGTGRLTQVTSYGDATSAINYGYDTNSLITSVTDADGKVLESHTYTADNSRRAATASRANGVDAVTVTYTSPTSTRITDSMGNFTDYAFTPVQSSGTAHVRNYVTGVSGPGCASCGLRNNQSFGYDGVRNANHVVDANSHATDFTFDQISGDMLTKKQYLDDGTPVTWTYTYNSFGEVLTAQDPLGVVTKNEYDAKGNLTCTSPDSASTTCSNAVIKTKFAYNTLGQLTQITDPRDTTQVPMKTNITYVPNAVNGVGNGAGQILTITDAQSKVTTYAYDARGNRLSVADPVNGTSNKTTFTYDALNRLKKITYPAISPNPATHTDFTYDHRGRRTDVLDPNQKNTHYDYDDADRLTQVTDAQTPNAGVTKYEYDTENNLTKITDALLRDTIFHYDALGHVYQTQFPSGLTEDYTYDQQGNLKTKTDRKRNLTTYNYDSMDRLKSKVYNDSTEVDYTYDNANRLKTVGGTAANGTYTLTYDNPGRLKQVDSVYSFLATKTWTVKYTYDNASNRATMVDPQNASTTYVYDTLNRLQTLTSPAGAFGFTYDALGRRLTLTRPNAVNTTYTYDAKSQLLSALHKKGTSTLDGATYTYDSAGNRLTKQDNRTSTTSTYGYDNIYQLTSATNGTEAYTYDLVGNRKTSTGVPSYNYNSSNELTDKTGVTYTYDNNGNTLTKVDSTGTTTYGWDFENRLISVTLPGSGGTVNFKYDPFGRRIQKTASIGSVNAIYVLDGADVLQEVNSTGATVVARYTMGLGIDQPLAEARGTTTSFYEADGLGSITSISKSNGALANTYTYDSFGKQTASSGTVVNNFRYTARELDSETGLMYYRARYYDQSSGRFDIEDPVRMANGLSFYAYVLNSPTNLLDPLGLTPYRWRFCTQGEVAFCKQDCASRGKKYQSCMVRQIYKIGPAGLGVGPVWLDGMISCSCKDPEECRKASVADPKAVADLGKIVIITGAVGAGILAPELIPELGPLLEPVLVK